MAVAIKGEDVLGRGVVNDAVGVRRGIGLTHHLQRLEIEYDRLALRAVTDEAASRFGYHCHTVALLQPGNLSLFFAGVCIYDQHFGPVRQVQAPRVGIEGDVIEILPVSRRSPEFIGVRQVVVDRGQRRKPSRRASGRRAVMRLQNMDFISSLLSLPKS